MKKELNVFMLFLALMLILNINVVKATDELVGEGAEISSAQVIQTKTGTGPFDENDEAGNDSSEDNDIVRSFDQVTWTIENTMVITSTETESYTGGKICFKAVLPDTFKGNKATWDVESMKWLEDAQLSSDGLTLTGSYSLTTENITIPGKQNLVFVAKILGASNDTEFKPEISLWLEGNTEEEYVSVDLPTTTVSATPRYNVALKQNSTCQKKTTVDYGEGNTSGRMYGYSLVVQLYNENTSKGLKGIELPSGEISFDIDLQLQRSMLGSTELEDITSECTPVLWNYKVNQNTSTGIIENRTMQFGSLLTDYERNVPDGVKTSNRTNSTYNSGNIEMTQNGSKITVNINDYDFDGTFPTYSSYGNIDIPPIYNGNVGTIGVYYFQVFVPDNEASTVGDRNYYLNVNDSNFSATSISGIDANTQIVTSDDKSTVNHVLYKPGTYNQHFQLRNYMSTEWIGSSYSSGDAKLVLGKEFQLQSKFSMDENNDDASVYSATKFIKFDGDAFEPILLSDGQKYWKNSFAGDMTFNVWYITKKDGTNWTSQEEMNSADIDDDMLYFENIEDIPDGYTCIGEYLESITGAVTTETGDNNTVCIALKIKEDATIGQTYAITGVTKFWIDYVDRNTYSITNQNFDEWPEVTWNSGYRNYIKTEYDENGNMIAGTHSGGWEYGQSVLVIGANQEITINTKDNKINYDVGKNENTVTYEVTPALKSEYNSTITDVTVNTKVILPSGISYVANSCNYGEPEITNNDDGTTTLEWSINHCDVNKAIEKITFDANINEESANGTQYTATAIIDADPEKIGITSEEGRKSTTAIQVINLSSYRLYKSIETPVIENDNEIHYKIVYKNNTYDLIPDFQLLDILPYNGDERGTSYNGTYTLDRLVITQEDSTGTVSNDNLTIKYTTDTSVRGTVTSKDENLGDGWAEVTSENIKNVATAFMIKGELGAQAKVTVDIYLKTEDNIGLDKYVNSATAQVFKTTEEMTTSSVTSQVVARKIEGIAWEDSDADGVKDDEESVFSNVEITLTDDQGNQVTDVNGNKVSSVRTDANGYYSFTDLPKGKYYVKVTMPSSKYTLTEKGVGANLEINSKFNVDSKETDEIAKLNSIDLPELTVSNVNAGLVKKATKVVVNYKEVGTDTILYDETTISGRIDDSYTTEDKIDEINEANDNKYEYVKVEGNTTGTMTEDTIYVTYYYQKKQSSIEVNYLEKGTNTVLSDQVTKQGQVDSSYTTEDKLDEINKANGNKYEFVETTGADTEGTYTVDKQVINYYYQKKQSSIEVNYLEVGTNTVLAEQVTKQGQIDSSYTTENKLDEINTNNGNKYEYVKVEGNTEGTYTLDKQTITYYYQKKATNVKVLHVLEGTDVTNPKTVTDVLYNTEEITGRVDDSYTTQNRLDEINASSKTQYELVSDEVVNKTGNMTVDTIYVIYEYKTIPAVVKVNHLEKGTNTVLHEQEILNGLVGNEYSTNDKLTKINESNGNKYELVAEPENKAGTYTKEEQTVTYYYQKKQSSIEVNYLEVGTNTVLAEQVTKQGQIDSDYTTENKLDEINENYDDKYEFVKVEGNTEGVYAVGKQTITYYYQKKAANVKVLHVEEGIDTTNPETVTDVLYNTEEITGKVDDSYTTQDRLNEINADSKLQYELVSVTENANGNMTLNTQYVIYVYKKIPAKVVVKYVDIDTNEELIKDETKTGVVGEEYETKDKVEEINETNKNKYVLVKTPENTEGTMTKDTIEVVYYYKKVEGQVIVKYVDEATGEEIAERSYDGGYVGDTYNTTSKEIAGYKLVESKIPENKEGKYIDGTIEVVYYYSKVEENISTGDTDIYSLTLIAIVSAIGITYFVRKNVLD